ncbi:hypothetical protein FB45DRAFT_102256 [Roridomyces roridus]|uniref:C3H1-type domain-containing protein n=1 Tax=Roridomyces roridus TaxID=1738132 RepID=A0AAD7BK27_9AGAR|nr:hypothetical protein FB45DRAFT_102256 [Roridomyces roridus]
MAHYSAPPSLCNNSGCHHSHTCPSYWQHPTFSHPVENIPPGDRGRRPSCIFFSQGRCTQGDKCRFSHNAPENKLTEPCIYFRQGTCRNGQNCPFLHETAPVASPPLSAKDSSTNAAELSPRLIPCPHHPASQAQRRSSKLAVMKPQDNAVAEIRAPCRTMILCRPSLPFLLRTLRALTIGSAFPKQMPLALLANPSVDSSQAGCANWEIAAVALSARPRQRLVHGANTSPHVPGGIHAYLPTMT